jgi:hypothetical protein
MNFHFAKLRENSAQRFFSQAEIENQVPYRQSVAATAGAVTVHKLGLLTAMLMNASNLMQVSNQPAVYLSAWALL